MAADRASLRPDREHGPTAFTTSSSRPVRDEAPAHLLSSGDEYSLKPLDSPAAEYDVRGQLPQVSFAPATGRSGPSDETPFLGGSADGMRRKKSLVRPDRARNDPAHPLFSYRQHAAAMIADGTGRVGLSSTGAFPAATNTGFVQGQPVGATGLRRGQSILAREEGMAHESGLTILKRGQTLKRRSGRSGQTEDQRAYRREVAREGRPNALSPWMFYCRAITCCFPAGMLRCFGMQTADRQRAWREKMGILGIILALMAAVGFLTFGFTQAVCPTPPLRFAAGSIEGGSMIFHGYDYAMDKFAHPGYPGIGAGSNPLYSSFNAGGKDGSFLFQTVNKNCLNIITPAARTGIPTTNGNQLGWYFPCNVFSQYGDSPVNKTGYAAGQLCHTQDSARTLFNQAATQQVIGMQLQGPVYYSWDQIQNTSRNLGVYKQNVLDFSLFNWLDSSQVTYPSLFNTLALGNNSEFRGSDITAQVVRNGQRDVAECMADIITVGFVDSETIGCIASDVVLYVSLVFIIGVVALKFGMAVLFTWFLSWRLGAFKNETPEQRRERAREIEDWTDDIYRAAPARYRPNVRKTVLPTKSRFTTAGNRISTYNVLDNRGRNTASVYGNLSKPIGPGMKNSPPSSPLLSSQSRNSSSSLVGLSKGGDSNTSRRSSISLENLMHAPSSQCPYPLAAGVVPQPGRDYEPFNFPLAPAICLVTAYSESVEGLRTTLDSLATTDYPNSHKLILVVADGLVRGSGNTMTTPDIVLSMMRDLVVPATEVQAYPYVAIADGHKRVNMGKIYAGFYDYDSGTVEPSKQQRVPIILVAKVGNPREARDAKPGNRGKRDSQVLIMSFLQKVMFDERMTELEFDFFNAMWRITGVTPDVYEIMLMVDADTKVFPDSLTRMAACMVEDPEIMGLCGETKIANKSETWVTMIQVFEYYISHHLTKAFESMFGGVTCLPGCFSMYRIKTPKGNEGYWVPILANPDIVEHYSENVVDTLHKKNLLLLGEDRYLTTLMLKTFPRRKMMFCPQAACKTVVPDSFRVLLSQRRRWINSTIHNLAELILVRDLCGTFCFSMQFVVGMELIGTLVLPAAIAFTIYLIIITIIPGTTKPIIPLILLGIILGLPGVLIVVTTRKMAYVGWMMIYLLSLPIWNALLPAYAFLHMDDFSWGATRMVAGEKGGDHSDKDGVFDSSDLVMRRWAEWQRERNHKTGNAAARDSVYDLARRASPQSASPRIEASARYSMASSSDAHLPPAAVTAGSDYSHGYMRSSPALAPQLSASPINNDGEAASVFPGPTRPLTLELPKPLAPSMNSSGSKPSSGRSSAVGDLLGDQHSETLNDGVYGRQNNAVEEERQPMLNARSPPLINTDFAPIRYQDNEVNSAASRVSRGFSLVDIAPVADPSSSALRTVTRGRRISTTTRTPSDSPSGQLPPGAARSSQGH